MVKTIMPICILLLMLSSCEEAVEKKGNGKIEMREFKVEPFTVIENEGLANVFISQDSGMQHCRVKVETDNNLLEYVKVKSQNGKLKISCREYLRPASYTRLNVYVRVGTLSKLENEGIGKLKFTSPVRVAESFELKSNAVGDMLIDVVGHKMEAKLSSVGRTILKGSMKEATIDNSSVGKMDASQLQTEVLHLDNSSVGTVDVYASKEIYIDSKGIGTVTYAGNAAVMQLETGGVGNVEKRQE